MEPRSRGPARLALGLILALTLGVRLVALDQPIVENYVGRQIPTAMVARNLERGSGFLRPELDVAPLPNLFLVEPPIYGEAVRLVRAITGLKLSAAGRVTSALGIVLAVWGLFGLVARREGTRVALVSALVFGSFPLTIRYGRAFQPDALMIGCLVAGMRGWEEFEESGRVAWIVASSVLISSGLALKIVSVYVLVPIFLVICRDRKAWKAGLLASTVVPALLWYGQSAFVLSSADGSRASSDNGAIWLSVFAGSALLRPETYRNLVRYLGIRAFTPLGPCLAVMGIFIGTIRLPNRVARGLSTLLPERRAEPCPHDEKTDAVGSRLWLIWAGSAFVAMLAVAAKLHHEYYWLSMAPVMAVGIARGWVAVADRCKVAGALTFVAFLGLCAIFSASTWRTPPEWRSLPDASALVQHCVPSNALLVAPEALLFSADRRGCRVEYTADSARRAAREWGDPSSTGVDGPAALVAFYQRQGAEFFADVVPPEPDSRRLALHESVRRRYNVVVDLPGVFIASLKVPNEVIAHGQASSGQ